MAEKCCHKDKPLWWRYKTTSVPGIQNASKNRKTNANNDFNAQDISLTIGASPLSFGVNKPTYIIHRPVVKQSNMESDHRNYTNHHKSWIFHCHLILPKGTSFHQILLNQKHMAQAPTKKTGLKWKKNPHIQKTFVVSSLGTSSGNRKLTSLFKSYQCAPCNSYPIDSPVGHVKIHGSFHQKQDHLADIFLHTRPPNMMTVTTKMPDLGRKVTTIRIPKKKSVNKTTCLQWPMITWLQHVETQSWGLIPNNS